MKCSRDRWEYSSITNMINGSTVFNESVTVEGDVDKQEISMHLNVLQNTAMQDSVINPSLRVSSEDRDSDRCPSSSSIESDSFWSDQLPVVWSRKLNCITSTLQASFGNLQQIEQWLQMQRHLQVEQIKSGNETADTIEKTNSAQLTEILSVLHSFQEAMLTTIDQINFGHVAEIKKKDADCQTDVIMEGSANWKLCHPLMEETNALRKDIDDITSRKKALDMKLKMLIDQKRRNAILDDVFLKGNGNTKESENKRTESNQSRNLRLGSYLNVISERDESVMCSMGSFNSVDNEDDISDLRNQEDELPGLGDSGLSEEIDSLNVTMNEMMRENQQLHSALKALHDENQQVNAEKLQLQCKIEQLVYDNENLNEKVKNLKMCKFQLSRRQLKQEGIDEFTLNSCSATERQIENNMKINECNNLEYKKQDILKNNEVTSISGGNKLQVQLMMNEDVSTDNKMQDVMKINETVYRPLEHEMQHIIKNIKGTDNSIKNNLEGQLNIDESVGIDRELQNELNNANEVNITEGVSVENKMQDLMKINESIIEQVSNIVPAVKCELRIKFDELFSGKNHQIISQPIHFLSEVKYMNEDFNIATDSQAADLPAANIGAGNNEAADTNVVNYDATIIGNQSNLSQSNDLESMRLYIDTLERKLAMVRKNSSKERCSIDFSPEESLQIDSSLKCYNYEETNPGQAKEFANKKKNLKKNSSDLAEEVTFLTTNNEELVCKLSSADAKLSSFEAKCKKLKIKLDNSEWQLENALKDSEDSKTKLRVFEESKEEASLSLSESDSTSRLSHRFKERIRHLQTELENVNADCHQLRIERDIIRAEKQSGERVSDVSLKAAHTQIDILTKSVDMLQNSLDLIMKSNVTLVKHDQETDNQKLIVKSLNEQLLKNKELATGDGIRGLQEQMQQMQTIMQQKNLQQNLDSTLQQVADQEKLKRFDSVQIRLKELNRDNEHIKTKYKRLHEVYNRLKRNYSDRNSHGTAVQLNEQLMQFQKTSDSLLEHYQVMLSSLGENIGVTVELLTSHVFLSPCVTHPCPDLRCDLTSWFAAQMTRLKWLQTQLRQLCLYNWKTSHLPKTSMLDPLVDSFKSHNSQDHSHMNRELLRKSSLDEMFIVTDVDCSSVAGAAWTNSFIHMSGGRPLSHPMTSTPNVSVDAMMPVGIVQLQELKRMQLEKLKQSCVSWQEEEGQCSSFSSLTSTLPSSCLSSPMKSFPDDFLQENSRGTKET